MTGWAAKRFWADASVAAVPEGYQVLLDTRPLRTPAKCPLILPSRAMAEEIAAEWQAVDKIVKPGLMPVTRSANSALDKVARQFDDVVSVVSAYGASDLLCYRATAPEALVKAQAEAWDPMLDWAERTYGARLVATAGVMSVAQPAEALRRLKDAVRASSPFQLTALHDLVALSGSLVLGLAATTGEFDPEMLWHLSRFDEDWQAGQWGEDEEASAIAEGRRQDFLRAHHFWKLSAPDRE
jgi:chaperone required for assembly of F1-ATPase